MYNVESLIQTGRHPWLSHAKWAIQCMHLHCMTNICQSTRPLSRHQSRNHQIYFDPIYQWNTNESIGLMQEICNTRSGWHNQKKKKKEKKLPIVHQKQARRQNNNVWFPLRHCQVKKLKYNFRVLANSGMQITFYLVPSSDLPFITSNWVFGVAPTCWLKKVEEMIQGNIISGYLCCLHIFSNKCFF